MAYFNDTNPKQGDSDWILLAKIVQLKGGTVKSNDSKNTLLRKWAELIS